MSTTIQFNDTTYQRVNTASAYGYAYRVVGEPDAYTIQTVALIGNEPVINRTMRRDIDNFCVQKDGATLTERGLARVGEMQTQFAPDTIPHDAD